MTKREREELRRLQMYSSSWLAQMDAFRASAGMPLAPGVGAVPAATPAPTVAPGYVGQAGAPSGFRGMDAQTRVGTPGGGVRVPMSDLTHPGQGGPAGLPGPAAVPQPLPTAAPSTFFGPVAAPWRIPGHPQLPPAPTPEPIGTPGGGVRVPMFDLTHPGQGGDAGLPGPVAVPELLRSRSSTQPASTEAPAQGSWPQLGFALEDFRNAAPAPQPVPAPAPAAVPAAVPAALPAATKTWEEQGFTEEDRLRLLRAKRGGAAVVGANWTGRPSSPSSNKSRSTSQGGPSLPSDTVRRAWVKENMGKSPGQDLWTPPTGLDARMSKQLRENAEARKAAAAQGDPAAQTIAQTMPITPEHLELFRNNAAPTPGGPPMDFPGGPPMDFPGGPPIDVSANPPIRPAAPQPDFLFPEILRGVETSTPPGPVFDSSTPRTAQALHNTNVNRLKRSGELAAFRAGYQGPFERLEPMDVTRNTNMTSVRHPVENYRSRHEENLRQMAEADFRKGKETPAVRAFLRAQAREDRIEGRKSDKKAETERDRLNRKHELEMQKLKNTGTREEGLAAAEASAIAAITIQLNKGISDADAAEANRKGDIEMATLVGEFDLQKDRAANVLEFMKLGHAMVIAGGNQERSAAYKQGLFDWQATNKKLLAALKGTKGEEKKRILAEIEHEQGEVVSAIIQMANPNGELTLKQQVDVFTELSDKLSTPGN